MMNDTLTLCLAGDVMTGRGVDQALPAPGDPRLWEPYVSDARTYLSLAERVNGAFSRPVPHAWPWGDALAVLDELDVDIRVVNLETSITARGAPDRNKDVHYRMHPANVGCLTAAHLGVCTLANNHLLDFGRVGLLDTLDTLVSSGLAFAGAGRTVEEARRPAEIPAGGPRVVVASCAHSSSGVPRSWEATDSEPGVDLLPSLGDAAADALAQRLEALRRPGDVTLVSIHWGSNWGHDVPREHVTFAHRLIDAGVDLVHGHSSHHPRRLELYRGKLVLYGCGDLIDDYEGITGYEEYRDDLRLLYLPTLDRADGRVLRLLVVPLQARQLRLHRAERSDTEWLRGLLSQVSHREVLVDGDGLLAVPV